MQKRDLKKELKYLYQPSAKQAEMVDVPKMNFLMIDGMGDPNTSKEFQAAIMTLYPLAYTLKFEIKKSQEIDYPVMPLEGLWWAEDMSNFGDDKGDRSKWQWTLMIMQPEYVTKELFEAARETVRKKKDLSMLDKVRLEPYDEGSSAQLMHIGPFSAEGPNILKVHDFIKTSGASFDGKAKKHHEIYLSDFRRVAPEKMKTVIRQPFIK
jgi:hypothetical protein